MKGLWFFFMVLIAFPLIQLPRKSEASCPPALSFASYKQFPLIQLPRKSEVLENTKQRLESLVVSINSTSEEVRRRIFGILFEGVF